MISTKHKFIFLHVVKTGGNSISHVLAPVSDNSIFSEKHHDGINRFAVSGPITNDKHAPLSVYAKALGPDLDDYRIMISVRHPFPRALSHYFTPSRWFRQTAEGEWYLEPPVWDEAQFLEDIAVGSRTQPASHWLDTTPPKKPDFVIHQESMNRDLDHAIAALGLPRASLCPLPHVNRTAAPNETLNRLLASTELRDIVEARFVEDMEAFGYASYVHSR